MNRLQESICLGGLLGILHGLLAPALAVPVVPNFTQGSMTSHTETTQKITETINSMDYNTGYQYSVTGSGITASGSTLQPGTGANNVTIEGVTSTWTGIGTIQDQTLLRQHQEQRFSSQKRIKVLVWQIKQ
jgi:hypothetical protein